MSNLEIELAGFTFAPVKMPAMVQFYNAVFHTELEPYEAYGHTLYKGTLAGFPLTFCPNELLGIVAEKNRKQLTLTVSDLDKVAARALANGGSRMAGGEDGVAVGIFDPDGNSLDLRQRK